MNNVFTLTLAALLLLLPSHSQGWWVKGHDIITRAAVAGLPEEVPAFFRASGNTLGYLAGDPDRWKNRDTQPLRAAESPDHYIDLEDLQGRELPPDRYQALRLLAELGQKPDRTGMLPYALMEHFDRLSIAFYDYRQEPTNEAIRMKCLVYAGVLAHYAGDAVMPLHTTRDYDGRKGQQKGIHARIDSFPEKHGLTAEEIGRGWQVRPVDDVRKHVLQIIFESHELVDRCYALDAANAFTEPTAESRAFILKRCQSGAQFLAELYTTAWKRSANLRASF
jgi:hypothetical protein